MKLWLLEVGHFNTESGPIVGMRLILVSNYFDSGINHRSNLKLTALYLKEAILSNVSFHGFPNQKFLQLIIFQLVFIAVKLCITYISVNL